MSKVHILIHKSTNSSLKGDPAIGAENIQESRFWEIISICDEMLFMIGRTYTLRGRFHPRPQI